jgi:hypothetical protein
MFRRIWSNPVDVNALRDTLFRTSSPGFGATSLRIPCSNVPIG